MLEPPTFANALQISVAYLIAAGVYEAMSAEHRKLMTGGYHWGEAKLRIAVYAGSVALYLVGVLPRGVPPTGFAQSINVGCHLGMAAATLYCLKNAFAMRRLNRELKAHLAEKARRWQERGPD